MWSTSAVEPSSNDDVDLLLSQPQHHSTLVVTSDTQLMPCESTRT